MPTPPYGRATAPWVRFCHILHSTHHSARSRRTRAVSDSTASSGRNSASSRSPALVLGCPFLSFSSTFRSRHQSLYLSSMVGYSNPEIQICKSAKDTPGTPLRNFFFKSGTSVGIFDFGKSWAKNHWSRKPLVSSPSLNNDDSPSCPVLGGAAIPPWRLLEGRPSTRKIKD